MGHPNLSPGLNALVENQARYADLKVGDTLEIFAQDAETHDVGSFRVQVVGFEPLTEDAKRKGLPAAPIFRFMGGDRPFHLYGTDRQTPVCLKKGTLAGAGISATHVPEFRLFMVGFGGIGAGRDYSFEYVGAKNEWAFAADIRDIVHHQSPREFRAPVKAVAAFLKRVERIRQETKRREELSAERLKRPLVIRTANSTYRLTGDDEGVRVMTKDGDTACFKAKLYGACKGGQMNLDVLMNGEWRQMLSSIIVSIEPDPDAD